MDVSDMKRQNIMKYEQAGRFFKNAGVKLF